MTKELSIFLICFLIGFIVSTIISRLIDFFYTNKKIDYLYKNIWVYSNQNLITFIAVFIVILVTIFFIPL